MIKIMVVDDEPLFRKAFRNLTDWELFDVKIIAECINGVEALNVLKTEQVDFVFTDIKMPVMDGLELIREAKKKYPHIQFIVSSAYGEFDYVREAYKLGAVDYVLKTEISEDEVMKIIKKHSAFGDKFVVDSSMKIYLAEGRFKELLLGAKENTESNILKLKEIGVNIGRNGYAIVSMHIYNSLNNSGFEKWKSESELFKFGVYNICEEIIQECDYDDIDNVFFVALDWNEYIFILTSEKLLNRNIVGAMRMICNECMDNLKDFFGIKVHAGIVDEYFEIKDIASVYEKAKHAVLYASIVNRNHVVKYEKRDDRLLPFDDLVDSFRKIIINLNTDINFDELKKCLLIESDVNQGNVEDVKSLYNKYILIILDLFYVYKFDNDTVIRFQQKGREILENITVSEANKYIYDVINLIECNFMDNLIYKVKKYIDNNIENIISLRDVANHFEVNPSYLSRQFKLQENIKFMDYLTKKKMEYAIGLLRQGKRRMDIAEILGYTSAEHFSRTFKKMYGVSPSEFVGGKNISS